MGNGHENNPKSFLNYNDSKTGFSFMQNIIHVIHINIQIFGVQMF